MTKYLLDMTDFLIMTTLCLVFAVTFQLFATLLKRIGKSLKVHFSEVLQKLMDYSRTKQYIDSMKPAVIPSIYWVIQAQNQNKKLAKFEQKLVKT